VACFLFLDFFMEDGLIATKDAYHFVKQLLAPFYQEFVQSGNLSSLPVRSFPGILIYRNKQAGPISTGSHVPGRTI